MTTQAVYGRRLTNGLINNNPPYLPVPQPTVDRMRNIIVPVSRMFPLLTMMMIVNWFSVTEESKLTPPNSKCVESRGELLAKTLLIR